MGHDVELQTQVEGDPPAPAWQIWFKPHAGELPQLQTPATEQLSAFVGSHVTHAPPAAPHALIEGVSHAAPEQQPFAHVCEQPVQALFTQLSLPGHPLQAVPPVPQAPGEVPAMHVFPEQQPVGQEVPLQTQDPFEQT